MHIWAMVQRPAAEHDVSQQITGVGKFINDFLDLDVYLGKNGKWPSLKLVYENLTWYPILALFILGIRALGNSQGVAESIAFWFLLPLFIFLLVATLVQTAVVLSVLAVGLAMTYVRPSERVLPVIADRKWFKLLVGAVLIVLGVVSFVSAVKVFEALSRLTPNG